MNDGTVKQALKKLARELLQADGSTTHAVTNSWMERLRNEYGEEAAEWAYDVLIIQRCQSKHVTSYHTDNGDVNVTDNRSDHSITAGGSVVGSAAGSGNMIQVGDVSLYNQTVEKSGMNTELATALKEGRTALAGIQVSEEVMQSVLENYGKLTIELQKPTPAAELVKLFWAPIQAFGKGIGQLARLGVVIGKVCGIPLPAPPT